MGCFAGANVAVDSNYNINIFTSSGVWTPTFTGTVEVMVVAGGGGGGTNMGGGGGGGGVLSSIAYSVTSGTVYTVTVGAAGNGAPAGNRAGHPIVPGTNGGNSIFGSYTAIGGGRGGMSYNSMGYGIHTGAAGGSGGGATGYNNDGQAAGAVTGGAGTAGQGNRGGNQGNAYYSGGGGGAGGNGADGNNRADGGSGILNSILDIGYYWAGGGGGAGHSTTGGAGGIGGGGAGAITNTEDGVAYNLGGGSALNSGGNTTGGYINTWGNHPGADGGQNTGGGGGGGSHYNANNKGGAGGSGIIIIKYLKTLGTANVVGGGGNIKNKALVLSYDFANMYKSFLISPDATNLDTAPNNCTSGWNINRGSSVATYFTFAGGNYSVGNWDFYKNYASLSTTKTYTWTADVMLGTASNLLVTINNSSAWDSGPSMNYTNLSTTEYRKVSITIPGQTTGTCNVHLGASANTEVSSTIQSAGTVYVKNIKFAETLLRDLSGTKNDATIVGNPTYSLDKSSLVFNGSNKLQIVGTACIPINNQDRTLTAWYEHSGTGNSDFPPLIWMGTNGTRSCTIIGINVGANVFAMALYSNDFNSNVSPVIGQKYFIVGSYSGSTRLAKLYINGIFNNSMTAGGDLTSTNTVYFGAEPAGRAIYGKISSACIYNKVLTDLEVKQLFAATRGRFGI
jgi:hypothetical protein